MENPNKEAYKMGKWPWIWAKHKRKILGVGITSLILWIYAAFDPDGTPWPILVFAFPAWFLLWYFYYTNLYNKQIRYYHNWEETYGGKLKSNKE